MSIQERRAESPVNLSSLLRRIITSEGRVVIPEELKRVERTLVVGNRRLTIWGCHPFHRAVVIRWSVSRKDQPTLSDYPTRILKIDSEGGLTISCRGIEGLASLDHLAITREVDYCSSREGRDQLMSFSYVGGSEGLEHFLRNGFVPSRELPQEIDVLETSQGFIECAAKVLEAHEKGERLGEIPIPPLLPVAEG